jgi:hypothetical protein
MNLKSVYKILLKLEGRAFIENIILYIVKNNLFLIYLSLTSNLSF